jgi:hypothetical protein
MTGYRLDDTKAATLYLTVQAQTLTPNVRFALDNFLKGLAKALSADGAPKNRDEDQQAIAYIQAGMRAAARARRS